MSEKDDIVRLDDLRAAGVCWRAGGRLFLIRHGFDPRDFLKNGIPADKLLATKDSIAERVVEVSRGRKKR